MIVYQSTKQGFRDDVFSNEIDKKGYSVNVPKK